MLILLLMLRQLLYTYHRVTMVWVMACLSAAHLYRTLTDFGGYHLDFTT